MGKPRGKPFQKGTDERRNAGGQRNRAAVQFARSLRELIVTEGNKTLTDSDGKKRKKIEMMVRQVFNKAILGEAWAVQFIAERTEGKIKEQVELSGTVGVKTYQTVSPDDWDNSPST